MRSSRSRESPSRALATLASTDFVAVAVSNDKINALFTGIDLLRSYRNNLFAWEFVFWTEKSLRAGIRQASWFAEMSHLHSRSI